MNHILTQKTFIFLVSLFLLSPGKGQDFLLPDKENDLNRQTRFIEAQSELIIGNTEGAIEIYKSLLKKDVNDDEAAFFLGKVYLNNEDVNNSIKYFSLALSNEKENPWYYIWAADAYLKDNQYDQATRTIESLVERFPNEKAYYDRLEFLYQDTKQYEKLIALINRKTERFGFHKNDALGKVQALENNDQPERALELLIDLAERYPRDLFILNMLANYYERNNEKMKALVVYQKILDLNPNDSRANIAVVEADYKDNMSGATKLLSKKSFFQNKNISFDTQFSEILPYFHEELNSLPNDEMEALERVSQWLLESHPDDPKALSLRADILAQTGQNLKAAEYYARTIKIHPDNYMVWEQLLWSLKDLHRWSELNQYADDATLYFPNKAAIYLLKGEAGYHLGDWDEALFDLETCLSLSAQDPVMESNARGMMALVECASNPSGNKQHTFEQARDVLDNNPNIDYFESQCLLKNSDGDQALVFIDKALEKVPEKPTYRIQKAEVLYTLGEYQKSLETVLPLAQETTYFPVYEWISKIYSKLNQPDNAEKYKQLAQKYGAPENNQIKN